MSANGGVISTLCQTETSSSKPRHLQYVDVQRRPPTTRAHSPARENTPSSMRRYGFCTAWNHPQAEKIYPIVSPKHKLQQIGRWKQFTTALSWGHATERTSFHQTIRAVSTACSSEVNGILLIISDANAELPQHSWNASIVMPDPEAAPPSIVQVSWALSLLYSQRTHSSMEFQSPTETTARNAESTRIENRDQARAEQLVCAHCAFVRVSDSARNSSIRYSTSAKSTLLPFSWKEGAPKYIHVQSSNLRLTCLVS